MEKLLTVEEVAEILGISKSTAKAWASRRIIPVIKMGRLIRISPQALQEWMRRNTELDREEAFNIRQYNVRRLRKTWSFKDYIKQNKE